MDYREHPPPPPLDHLIECLWVARSSTPSAPSEIIVPDGCMELIFHVGEPYRVVAPSGVTVRQPASLFHGQLTRALRLLPGDAVCTIGVRFRPAGARPFLGLPPSELRDASVPLEALAGRAARQIEEELPAAASDAERLRLVGRFVADRLRTSGREPGSEARWAEEVVRRRGRLSIDELASHAGLGRRQLERRFKAAVGLSPKRFARLIRFQSVLHLLGQGYRPGWIDVALDCGYYDQAHLIRDFRQLADISPTAYRPGREDLASCLASRARLDRFFAGA